MLHYINAQKRGRSLGGFKEGAPEWTWKISDLQGRKEAKTFPTEGRKNKDEREAG